MRSQHLASALPTASSAELVSHIAALGRLARFAPTAFETRSEEITTFLLGQVVSKATDPDDVRPVALRPHADLLRRWTTMRNGSTTKSWTT